MGGGGGEPWPHLALFGLVYSYRRGWNEATVASFGTPFTRTRRASRPWLWPWLASSGVARSGETFKSLSFPLISCHSSRSRWRWGQDARFPACAGSDGGVARSGEPLIQSHFVSFPIPRTLILRLLPGGEGTCRGARFPPARGATEASPGVARPLIQSHFVSFRLIPYPRTLILRLLPGGKGPAGVRGSRLPGEQRRRRQE